MTRPILADELCSVVSNENVGPALYLLVLRAPGIAAQIMPGQFVHVNVPGMPDKILRRPFSVFQADPEKGTIAIVYQVVGGGTQRLGELEAGTELMAIGPIGRSWSIPESCTHPLLVGGGVGAAPLFMLAEDASRRGLDATVVLGAQTRDALVTLQSYEGLGLSSLVCATDDGTYGHAGFCTQPAQDAIAGGAIDFVACCGPEPLMKIVAGLAEQAGLECQVSLEKRMACGIGACLSCVVDTVDGKKRACVDGPIFDASKVVW